MDLLPTLAEPGRAIVDRNIMIYKSRPEPMGPPFQSIKNGEEEWVSLYLSRKNRYA